ncbi:MAG: S41 family peptidase [Desulfobacterales bacterium]|nr:S41 family peptidase [Desulfobacterales bacterium]MCP4161010.1 S41 family peptidase [Deltaproteobacteria bacterium]
MNLSFKKIFLILISITLFTTSSYADQEKTYKKLKIFTDVLDEISKNYVDPVESDKLIQMAISGMVQNLDPHSSFLTPSAFKALQDDTKGRFTGIGIEITMRKGKLIIVSPIEDTPADKAGLKAGDIIFKVDGILTDTMTSEEAVNKIKGKKGTSLVITIIRKEVPEPFDVRLVRDEIPNDTVKYAYIKQGFGYVSISNFNENTTEDLEKALRKINQKRKPLKGLVLDLRNNPGGLLNQAIKVSDLFINRGIIVSIRNHAGNSNQVWQAHKRTNGNYPIVVLINGGSASASEIVAGALKDHKRALILGTTSFGKGSVQTIKPLRGGYAIKYTIARYYTPKGTSIQALGIEPDLYLPYKRLKKSEREEYGLRERDLKNHLKAISKKPTSVKTKIKNRFGLSTENLLRDNQVSRAYEILLGQSIFQQR